MQHDLNDMLYFAEVAERGGFTAAARTLDVPKSRLSRRIADLEGALGVQLLQRSTRRLSLTAAGEEFLRHCVEMREAAGAAVEAVAHERKEPGGTVRLSCPVTLAQSGVGALLPRFMRRHPQVRVEMLVLNRPVDPIEEGMDLALRVRLHVENSASLAVRVFGHSRGLLLAAPGLLARSGAPARPEDLVRLDSVAMTAADGRAGMTLHGPGGAVFHYVQAPRYMAGDLATLRYALLAGVGVGMLPDYLCRDDLREGRLVPALPGWEPPGGVVHAMFPPRRARVPAVRALLDFLGEYLGAGDPHELGAD